MAKILKKRAWGFILYPESAPEDWLDRLKRCGLKCAVSPLHDRDVNPDGEVKKSHYHVILYYNGPTSSNAVSSFCHDVLNGTYPIPLESVEGDYRYFTHQDNPEKFQYCKSDIICLNGFNIRDFSDLTRSETLDLISQVIDFIEQYNIFEYYDLIIRLRDDPVLLDVAVNHTVFFSGFLKSKFYSYRRAIDSTIS